MNDHSRQHPSPAAGASESPAAESGVAVTRRREDLPPAAQRALAEAEARRKAIDDRQKAMPREIDGRGGLDPARYDDWEVKGIASDF